MVTPALLDGSSENNYHSEKVNPSKRITLIHGFLLQNRGEGGSSFVQYRPQLEPLDDIGRFLGSLRFDQRGKLEQLGIEIGSLALLTGNIGSRSIPKFICHL